LRTKFSGKIDFGGTISRKPEVISFSKEDWTPFFEKKTKGILRD